jgi:hypothetical protein
MLVVVNRIIRSAIAVDRTLTTNGKSVQENAKNMDDKDVKNHTVFIFEFTSP